MRSHFEVFRSQKVKTLFKFSASRRWIDTTSALSARFSCYWKFRIKFRTKNLQEKRFSGVEAKNNIGPYIPSYKPRPTCTYSVRKFVNASLTATTASEKALYAFTKGNVRFPRASIGLKTPSKVFVTLFSMKRKRVSYRVPAKV